MYCLQRFKRFVCVALVMALLFAAFPVYVSAAQDTDTSHWAQRFVDTLYNLDIAHSIQPDAPASVDMLNGWVAGVFRHRHYQLPGDVTLTRLDGILLVARAFYMSEVNPAILQRFPDYHLVSEADRPAVAAMVAARIVRGHGSGPKAGLLDPDSVLTQGQAAALLLLTAGPIFSEPGAVSDLFIPGNAVINTGGVVFDGVFVGGNLIVTGQGEPIKLRGHFEHLVVDTTTPILIDGTVGRLTILVEGAVVEFVDDESDEPEPTVSPTYTPVPTDEPVNRNTPMPDGDGESVASPTPVPPVSTPGPSPGLVEPSPGPTVSPGPSESPSPSPGPASPTPLPYTPITIPVGTPNQDGVFVFGAAYRYIQVDPSDPLFSILDQLQPGDDVMITYPDITGVILNTQGLNLSLSLPLTGALGDLQIVGTCHSQTIMPNLPSNDAVVNLSGNLSLDLSDTAGGILRLNLVGSANINIPYVNGQPLGGLPPFMSVIVSFSDLTGDAHITARGVTINATPGINYFAEISNSFDSNRLNLRLHNTWPTVGLPFYETNLLPGSIFDLP